MQQTVSVDRYKYIRGWPASFCWTQHACPRHDLANTAPPSNAGRYKNVWKQLHWSRASSVGMATRWTARIRFPAGANDSLLLSVHTESGTHPAWYPVGTGSDFPGRKAATAFNWPLTSLHCRSQELWSYISTPPYIFTAWSESELKLLYDWRFVLAARALRLTTSNFIFQLNTCGYCPHVTSSPTRGWVCRL
jgi:hypothetical protein